MNGEDQQSAGMVELDVYRLTDGHTKSTERGKGRPATRTHVRREGLFVRGPVPWTWMAAAARLPGRALHVAMALRLLAGMRQGGPVSLSGARLRELGVGRHAGYRALCSLEQAGLVAVVRRRGRQPVVTICELASGLQGAT